jgi:RNA polymerase-binding protein DksA
MAAAKNNKVGSSRSPKKTVSKAPAKAVAKPVPKKAVVKKQQPLKPAPRPPAKLASKPVSKPAPKAAPKPAPKLVAPVTKPKIVNKAPPPSRPAPKAATAAAAIKKDLVKKTVSTASHPPSKTAHAPAHKPATAADPKKPRFLKGDLEQFKHELLSMRDRITGQSGSMRSAALQRNDETNTEEDGTDAFMRLQTLEQVSSQQQIISNIDESLRSIEKGSYGVCDMCGELINKPRLSVLPFAKNCIKCQSEMERPNRFVGRR